MSNPSNFTLSATMYFDENGGKCDLSVSCTFSVKMSY